MAFMFTIPQEAKLLRDGGAEVYDVSSRAAVPYRYLSPFYPHGGIPVPGMPGRCADSVEGVWQGLKIINGRIDESYFVGRGRKRRAPKGGVGGHKHGERRLDYIQARQLIYVPLYRWMVYNVYRATEVAIRLLRKGLDARVWLHDVDQNSDITDPRKPLAHASVLVFILNENLRILQKYADDPLFRKEYDEDRNGNGVLAYPLADVLIQEQRSGGSMKNR